MKITVVGAALIIAAVAIVVLVALALSDNAAHREEGGNE